MYGFSSILMNRSTLIFATSLALQFFPMLLLWLKRAWEVGATYVSCRFVRLAICASWHTSRAQFIYNEHHSQICFICTIWREKNFLAQNINKLVRERQCGPAIAVAESFHIPQPPLGMLALARSWLQAGGLENSGPLGITRGSL